MERFRAATFNVNSVRARLPVVLGWLERHGPDVLCLQETKVSDADFPAGAFRRLGYEVVFRGMKGYNGVAVAARGPVEAVRTGFGDPEDTPEDHARLIRLRVRGVDVVNTYVPQGRAADHPLFRYKLRWFDRLLDLFRREYRPERPLLWCGDLNVAPEPADVYAPERLAGHVCFHPEARARLARVTAWGLVDVFRRHVPGPGHYTFFDYRVRGALERNLGWRIDHVLATPPLAAASVAAFIDLEPRRGPRPSDHAVLAADFEGVPAGDQAGTSPTRSRAA
ncbi:exodeoxyribonuclease III [Dissulfurirhabdus thermomarina]|uniref:Exodeoxyribonuclease III n=2 Tax=Dissulfurirhabdus thermomarina TaxID=1765737 RepID=A0A6N9TJN1_DISTH|nr:exodeoxyribonuclease III [Dissulfurirhabdus thermomarina]NDY41289.1 exodeoxyribonuclease III [Dissulfurirhabdus thermomarina]NMX23746.1 exodeoxyribonuclease III [Dissulfurirhabdus thermomarina]